jgi:uncharacterized protein (TIGR02145 family)
VNLTDLRTIPSDFAGITEPVTDEMKAQLRGAIIYNTNPTTGVGIYIWAGMQWILVGSSQNILYDAQGNDYTTGDFGAAGVWMTQNLRTTQKQYDGIADPLQAGTSLSDTQPYYTYPTQGSTPTIDKFKANPDYGLLYNWVAASGRTGSETDTEGLGTHLPGTTRYQGICPTGWYLPSDYEWSVLEREIATNPGRYSTQNDAYAGDDSDFFSITSGFRLGTNIGYTADGTPINPACWGYKMKSMKPVVGSVNYKPRGVSHPCTENGFDVLLVGLVLNGSVTSYGTTAIFWSSSSNASTAYTRSLTDNSTGVVLAAHDKRRQHSIRCKKGGNANH